jgi:hypothetical protein
MSATMLAVSSQALAVVSSFPLRRTEISSIARKAADAASVTRAIAAP